MCVCVRAWCDSGCGAGSNIVVLCTLALGTYVRTYVTCVVLRGGID